MSTRIQQSSSSPSVSDHAQPDRFSAGLPHAPRSLLLCGGGTGGHVYPALAVASALHAQLSAPVSVSTNADGAGLAAATPSNQPNAQDAAANYTLLYVGSPDGMERGLVARESDLPFRAISAAAIRGRNPLVLLRNSAILGWGLVQARALLRRERPAAILGTGGYVCVPLFVAARQMGIPSMIYLPDIVPGLAVKLLARLATRVACSFEPSLRYLPRAKTVVTGYPVRPEFFELDKAACRQAFDIDDDLPVVVVYGGSRGARSVNQAIKALLPDLLDLAHVIHVCGREGDDSWLQAAAQQLPAQLQQRYHLFPYLFSGGGRPQPAAQSSQPAPTAATDATLPAMVQAFGAADLAIARSGASTLAELPAAKLPSVLVPYPYVNQDQNADYMVEYGAALKVDDGMLLGMNDPRSGALWPVVERLLRDQQARSEMAARSAALARPDAADRIAIQLVRLAAHREGA